MYIFDIYAIGGIFMSRKGRAMTDAILTLKQIADYLKMNERTIYRLAAHSEIPAFKVGNSWRFKRSDLECWIAEQQANQGKASFKDAP